jgi:hypothetical protein
MAFFGVTATLEITADGTSIVTARTPAPETVRTYKDLVSGLFRPTLIGKHLALVSVYTHNVTIATLRTMNVNSKQQQKTTLCSASKQRQQTNLISSEVGCGQ